MFVWGKGRLIRGRRTHGELNSRFSRYGLPTGGELTSDMRDEIL